MKISNKSQTILKETFAQYKDADPVDFGISKTLYDRAVFHIYPVGDTLNDENEESAGYTTCLLFDLHIYDTKNMQKYILSNRDGIDFIGFENVKVHVFKDQSTMIAVDVEEIQICNLKLVTVTHT